MPAHWHTGLILPAVDPACQESSRDNQKHEDSRNFYNRQHILDLIETLVAEEDDDKAQQSEACREHPHGNGGEPEA
ncbi:hypothetical protein D3C71_1297020 [compost metagenome]